MSDPPPPPSSAPPPAAPEAGLEAVADAFENVVAPAAHKPGSLAALLTVAAPGMGHVFLEVEGAQRTRAFGMLAATIAAVVLSCFVSFPIAVVVYLAAVVFALTDLREQLAPLQQSRASEGPLGMFSDLGTRLSRLLVIGGGVLLAIAVLLPWYRESAGGVSVSVTGRGALSQIDWMLAVIGIGAAVVARVKLTPGPRPGLAGAILTVAGMVALALVLFRLLLTPAGLQLGVERSFGLLLAFASAVLLAGGGAGAAASKS